MNLAMRPIGMNFRPALVLLLTPLCCLPGSPALAQEGVRRETVTVYVVYSLRRAENSLSKGMEFRNQSEANRHADGLRRVQDYDGNIYAEVKVVPEQRSVIKRDVPPPREPEREPPWKGKGKVGGPGEGTVEDGEDESEFFRPESGEQIDERIEQVNEGIEGGLTDEELYEAIKEGGVEQFLRDDGALDGIDLGVRMKELEETRKALETERIAIEQEERVLQAAKRRLHQEKRNSLAATKWAEYLDFPDDSTGFKDRKRTFEFREDGTVVSYSNFRPQNINPEGKWTVRGDTLEIREIVGPGKHLRVSFRGTIRDSIIEGDYSSWVYNGELYSRYPFRFQLLNRGQKSETESRQFTPQESRIRLRRQALERKTSAYKSQLQQYQQDQKAFQSKRKHRSLEPSGVKVIDGFGTDGSLGAYKIRAED